MSEASPDRPSVLYWAVCAVLLLWGALGVLVYAGYFIETPEQYAKGVENAEHQEIYADYVANIPFWAIGTGVVAAAGRLFGAVGLLLRQTWAQPLYVVSLSFFLITLFRAFVLANAAEAMSGHHIAIEVVFAVLSVFAVWFAHRSKATGVLRHRVKPAV